MITAEYIKAQGNDLFKAGEYASAIAKYDQAHDLDPTNPTYESNAAACWEKLGNYAMMEKAARKSLSADESFIKGHFRLAMALKHQNDFKGCANALESGLAIDSSNEDLKKLKVEVLKLIDKQVNIHICDAEEMLLNGDIAGAYNTLENARQLDANNSKIESLMMKVKPKWEKLKNAKKCTLISEQPCQGQKSEGDLMFGAKKDTSTFTFSPQKSQSNPFKSSDGGSFQLGTNTDTPTTFTFSPQKSQSNPFKSSDGGPFQFGAKKDTSTFTFSPQKSQTNPFKSSDGGSFQLGMNTDTPTTFTFSPQKSKTNPFKSSDGGPFQFGSSNNSSTSSEKQDPEEDDIFKISKAGEELFSKFTKELNEQISSIKSKKKELTERHKYLLGKKNELLRKNGGSKVQGSDIIKLNVGGTEMYASRDTLTAVKGSRLDALFCGRWENKLLRDEEGRVFLDLDPDVFKSLLEYLQMFKISGWYYPVTRSIKIGLELFPIYMEYFIVPLTISTPERKESKPCQNIQETIANEDSNLKQYSLQLDDMESQILAEEEFVKYFIFHRNENERNGTQFHLNQLSVNQNSPEVNDTSNQEPTAEEMGIINLIVDGKKVAVKKSTICLYPDTKLARLITDEVLSNQNSTMEENKSYILLEMPLYAFKSIINELRMRSMKIQKYHRVDATTMDRYEADNTKEIACYYLQSHVEIHTSHAFLDSAIVKKLDHRAQLVQWLADAGHHFEPKLLFRASRDGFNAFENKCGNQGPTVTIVKTNSRLVGGYSDVSWQDFKGQCSNYRGRNPYIHSSKCFLFSLENFYSDNPERYTCIHPSTAISTAFGKGPSFGAGTDLEIKGSNAYSLFRSYKYDGNQSRYSFFGEPSSSEGQKIRYYAPILDYEVYKV